MTDNVKITIMQFHVRVELNHSATCNHNPCNIVSVLFVLVKEL